MSMLRKIQRVGKRASKFQYTATYQSIVVECTKDKWRPRQICVSWTRRGRRLVTKLRPWQPSPDNKARGVVIWPEPETMEITVTLYKGPKDKSYENKEWEFAVIDVDVTGKRKVLATAAVNMVRYASSLPFEHDLHLRLKPVSRKIKSVILDVSLTSEFLKEGKATDEDMMSIASMMSVSNLSTIGFLEDDEDDDFNYMTGGRSISPPEVPDHILSTDELLKWAQEIVKDLPNIKITNMTTSWRNGMGFLAVIHYYRPDLLPDYDMQSPNSIKENNRTAFNIARSLGIACPLTPNMMVTTTIPDKLQVMSFLYQMYQYFTRARPSAIAHSKGEGQKETPPGNGSRGTSPSSPFDISKFEMFSKSNISPVTTPPPTADRVMHYSRHNVQRNTEGESEIETPNKEVGDLMSRSSLEQVHMQSTPISTSDGESSEMKSDTSSSTAAKLKLDQIVTEHAQKSGKQGVKGGENVDGGIGNRDQDRELEFEITTDTESSQTGSSISILEDKSIPELPSEIKAEEDESSSTADSSGFYKYTPGKGRMGSKTVHNPPGRKLPSVPRDTSSPKLSDKREEIRKQAQEMLRKHKLDKFKMSSHDSFDSEDQKTSSKYREKALSMLSQAIGTPKSSKRGVSRDELASEGSSTSVGVVSTDEEISSRSADNLQAYHSPLMKEQLSDSVLNDAKKTKIRKLPQVNHKTKDESGSSNVVAEVTSDNEPSLLDNSELKTSSSTGKSEVGKLPSEPVKKEFLSKRRSSESSLATRKYSNTDESLSQENRRSANANTSRVTAGGERKRKLSADVPRTSSPPVVDSHDNSNPGDASRGRASSDISRLTSTNRPSSAVTRPKKKVIKPAPVARPISAQPSKALKRLAEQRRLEEEKKSKLVEEERKREMERKKALEKEALEKEANASDNDGVEVQQESRSEREDVSSPPPQKDAMEMAIPAVNGTPIQKKSLPSPSTWSQHSDDIYQDILVTQSDYVKTELLSLQSQVQELEERARNIEVDIRGAMSIGNKEEEELMMQEWFGLLNKKNEFIRRQIELNIIEKEEDLEKRQFFLNRELRPLMEIPEDQKSTEQKEREAHLLRELLELIDDRDKLERRKMANSKNVDYDREGLANAQVKSADIVHGKREPHQMARSGSKDCVIS